MDEGADCCIVLPAPGFWLQTGPCMPYGLWLRVATHIYINTNFFDEILFPHVYRWARAHKPCKHRCLTVPWTFCRTFIADSASEAFAAEKNILICDIKGSDTTQKE